MEIKFRECETCHQRPDKPILCGGCLANWAAIETLKNQLEIACAAIADLEAQLAKDETGPIRASAKPPRNQPCPCGSGRKFKRCCLEK